ncbi:MAG: 50S ribosomal protein L11 methyltransferase [Leptospirillum sp.]
MTDRTRTVLFKAKIDPKDAPALSEWLEQSTGQIPVEELFGGTSTLSVSVGHLEPLARTLLAEASRSLGGTVLPEEILEGSDWDALWKKQGFSAFRINHWLNVVPEWENPVSNDGPVLRIHPHLAFGTGLHETTGQCLSLLVDHAPRRKNPASVILDFGAGTGILGIAALRLGYGDKLYSVDNDPLAVEATEANLRLNALERKATVGTDFQVMSRKFLEDGIRFGLILANVTGGVILGHLPEWYGLLETGGILILSGISTREMDRVQSVCPPPFSVYRKKRFHTLLLRKLSC